LIPLIAIVGRPNVGKSTLFNRMLGKRRALVDDEPGVTRDHIYGQLIFRDQLYHLLDTGGFEPEPGGDLLIKMRDQTELAIAEADAVIFLLDGKEGLVPSDEEVARILRRQNKPVFFAVNKIDSKAHEGRLADFYRLGSERLFPLSAEHGMGTEHLLEAIQAELPGGQVEDESESGPDVPRIAVVGRPNTGKSTLINRVLGKERHLVHEAPGTTRDSVDSLVKLQGKSYLFIDTAGIRKRGKVNKKLEKLAVIMALKSLERCDLALLLLDASEGATEQDARIAGLIHERGRASIILLNKWDLIAEDPEKQDHARNSLERRIPHLAYAPGIAISAKTGMGLANLAPAMDRVLDAYSRRIRTGELNRLLEEVTRRHSPPSYKGKQIKFYYVTQASTRPPTFVFSVNRPEGVKESFRRYLANQIQKAYEFEGTPLRIVFRSHRERRGGQSSRR
jgi:GTP-binding protein